MVEVKSARRVAEVLDLIASRPPGLTFSEIQRATGWPESSLHGLLGTLGGERLIGLDPVTRRYHLGSRLWQWARIYQDRLQLLPTALPYLARVRDALNETVQLAVLDRDHVIYVAKMESSHPLNLASSVGSRLPAYATGIGKAMLAALDDDAVRALYPAPLTRFTPRTAGTLAQLMKALQAARDLGYAIDRGEYSEDVRCVAIPILGEGGAVVAGLSVSVPQARFDRRFSRAAAECLADHGYALAETLGAEDPEGWRRGVYAPSASPTHTP